MLKLYQKRDCSTDAFLKKVTSIMNKNKFNVNVNVRESFFEENWLKLETRNLGELSL